VLFKRRVDSSKGSALSAIHSRIAFLIIIVVTLVCVAGVLILPQVDLPNFLVNGSKSPTITVIHAATHLSSYRFDDLGISNPARKSSRLRRSGSVVGDAAAFSALTKLLSLRC
jgi:hypothetical protein